MYPEYDDYYDYNSYPMYYPYPPMYKRPPLIHQMRNSLSKVTWSTTLRNTQRTIYTINQIIPIIYQLKPVISNATQAFKITKALKQFDLDEIDHQIQEPYSETIKENVL